MNPEHAWWEQYASVPVADQRRALYGRACHDLASEHFRGLLEATMGLVINTTEQEASSWKNGGCPVPAAVCFPLFAAKLAPASSAEMVPEILRHLRATPTTQASGNLPQASKGRVREVGRIRYSGKHGQAGTDGVPTFARACAELWFPGEAEA
jgi:hypothetical protein